MGILSAFECAYECKPCVLVESIQCACACARLCVSARLCLYPFYMSVMCCGCARGCARGMHQPQGTVAALNASVCLSRECGGVCMQAWRLSGASARSSPRPSIVARRARPHACAVRGRYIFSTKVKALPEWLGQCRLLQTLCVRARRRCRTRRCRRCACAAAPGDGPHRAALDAAAAALPVAGRGRAPCTLGWRPQPTG
jgi:hypothetical protein